MTDLIHLVATRRIGQNIVSLCICIISSFMHAALRLESDINDIYEARKSYTFNAIAHCCFLSRL